MAKRNVALVAGALGITGRNLVRYLDTLEQWDVVALSRRSPDFATRATFLSLDLLYQQACKTALRAVRGITHVFFCAYSPGVDEFASVEINLRLLTNLVESLELHALARLVLVEGAKWNGAHLGPYRTPAKEADPRHLPPNFYCDQEDYVRARATEDGWTWAAVRPSGICGFSSGNPMNLSTALAVYCVISKELGLPLRFPGKPGAFRAVCEMTDATHLARALVWSATDERCTNEAFNITNGDYIRWQNIWPAIAACFDMTAEAVQTISLSTYMADKADLWQRIVAKYDLRPYRLEEIAAWPFLDAILGIEYDIMSDTVKARESGFADVVDTTKMFSRIFAEFRSDRIIP
jgi:nucleoside-diphosphate-sugar epimerase